MTGSVLIEFPPVLCGRSIYVMKNNGAVYSVSRVSGRVRWKRKLGDLAAASPACAHGTVYAVLLARGKGIKAGRVVAGNAAAGKTRGARKVRSRGEASPPLPSGPPDLGARGGAGQPPPAGGRALA